MVFDVDGNPYQGEYSIKMPRGERATTHAPPISRIAPPDRSLTPPGLTGGTGWDRRVDFIIPEKDRKAGKGEYYIEASCNGMFGINDNLWSPEFGGTVSHPDVPH